jgi:hypothetical protein
MLLRFVRAWGGRRSTTIDDDRLACLKLLKPIASWLIERGLLVIQPVQRLRVE